ncbi:MAG: NAD(P)H-dependent oxidoreductase subunit E [Lentisphaerae bacterium]|jgi:NADH-quinone oxidoreductase subunit E|nr:NAD(P)H-dependent oxidoreductase subunit E [Lentisphaerota bacterium]MBT4822325.1 NAD(P)H-dependent oxidoreductase subunit E [Lentisphaerota bacterium]MBT5608492.1 NAD(P)H-dependent oxidoreductase subunit E [Lentisphaerota bacterium]MBT7058500.1 NAD(P)H-dependent oxidoreductase subunit E [Lentisphaerota bacterium]MBT7845070.1 NAD(P)H-dependent oxidoreductase subunit E [Lentisphaerota bacterium]
MPTVTEPALKLRQFEAVCRILDRFGRDPMKLIPILQDVQEEYRYLPEEVMTFVATSLGLPPARVFGVATFYSHFAIEPKGKYVVRLCDGTACHVKKSTSILDALYQRLGLSEKNTTTPDLLITVETVSCLGACGLAPVMCINDDVHGQVTPDRAVALIEDIMKEENA